MRFISTLVTLICVPLFGPAHAEDIRFNRDIRPILSDRCFLCHGPGEKDRKASLRLDQADGPEGAYRTHKGVTAIKPGALEESEVWYRITSDDADEVMPPPESHKKVLSAKEQALLRSWIETGAVYENFWAFEPARMPATPEVKNTSWSAQQIDRLVLKELETRGLNPSPEADQRLLLRRLTFDLTGLPPTREELHRFLQDKRPEAYSQRVDELLARPAYGEHLARYWLDLVRFADSNGMHKDFYRNFIAYRDWVIRAYNDNLGYDDFLRYQLAGDLYPDPSQDQLIASGFNRLHLIIDRGTALPEESYTKNVVDRVTAVGTAFMGLTVHCAMCHDHKYDPITQKDFYGLFAFFNNLDADPETSGAPANGLQPPFISLPAPEHEARLKEFEQQLTALDAEEADENAREKKRKALTKQRDQFKKNLPGAMVMRERAEVRPAYFLKRGQYDDPGEEVSRAAPSFLPGMQIKGDLPSRMDLSDWMVEPSHPLTARVAVNRFWQQFFGVGLVKTAEDFGAQGEVPSHPELLDYLAVSFVASGWDVKALVKEIVLSKTYRQSSLATPEQFREDAENRFLARASRFRLDAEVIRDQILASSGLLAPTLYGPSVKPPQPDGLWKAVTMTGDRYRADAGEGRVRRSLYTYWKRAMPPPQMTILNAPNRDACVARRERTNTPSQALLLLNESEYMRAARTFAELALKQEGLDETQRLRFAYEALTSRLPDTEEQAVLLHLLNDLTSYYREHAQLADALCEGVTLKEASAKASLSAWTVLVNTLYNLDITKNHE
jgi:hypothetical protein